MARFLWEERGLRLEHPPARVLSCFGHIDALGHRISREGHQALPAALRRLTGRVTAELVRPPGERPAVDVRRSLAASVGVLLF